MKCTNISRYYKAYLFYKICEYGCLHGDKVILCVIQSDNEGKEVTFAYGRWWLSFEFNPC
jgi:hypothetical protein